MRLSWLLPNPHQCCAYSWNASACEPITNHIRLTNQAELANLSTHSTLAEKAIAQILYLQFRRVDYATAGINLKGSAGLNLLLTSPAYISPFSTGSFSTGAPGSKFNLLNSIQKVFG